MSDYIRKPAVAGAFYSSNAVELREQIERLLESSEKTIDSRDILGIISPHAGYVYSAECAAQGYKNLAQKKFDTAIIIAPSHRVGGFDFSVGDFSAYETPLGNLEVNREITEKLKQNGIGFFPAAHKAEHSLEVQLPFLQVINPSTSIVPIIFGSQNPNNAKKLAKILEEIISPIIDTTALIISSDLSHFYHAETAEKMDMKTARLIEKKDFASLSEMFLEREIEACGFGGILTSVLLADYFGYRVKNLEYTHSGKISGINSEVVGYLSSIFYK